MTEAQKPNCLLSDDIVPELYSLQLEPDLEEFTFQGAVCIHLKISKPACAITLHAADLEIKASDVTLWHFAEPYPLTPQEVVFDPKAETATFIFNKEFPAGRAMLKIKYIGVLSENMVGFYRSKYTTADGQTKHLAVTQFEATDARRALPCWDEPTRKAAFDVRLIVPKNLTALSNMPVETVKPIADTDLKVVRFARTPVMSTYLLAFVVGEFDHVSALTQNKTLVSVYTLPGQSAQGKFALDVGCRALDLYSAYFDSPYPLPKLDMIAIPNFASGAMENWGLVTYRENALLFDEANSSLIGKQRVGEVVTHELAHQWFGNLVTMTWWTNLWLNEGFATWMANFALDHLFPEWEIWNQFLSDDCASALSLDGLRSSHPIEVPVSHPNEISQIFDDISYSKGACVIRMIHDFIGADAFRVGMQIYLKRHAYGNAVTEDLWQALTEASGKPVKKIMDTWTKQTGYPLIQMTRRDDRTCVLSQKRFLTSGGELTETEAGQRWDIPLALEYHYQAGAVERVKNIFDGGDNYIVPLSQEISFVKLNIDQTAFVRVDYMPEQWQALGEAVDQGRLAVADRYGLANDALSLARAGHLPPEQLIKFLSLYKNENNYSVWMMILGALGALNNITDDDRYKIYFGFFARSMLRPLANKLGWEETHDESPQTKLLRGQALAALGNYGDSKTITEARNRFREHMSDARPADPNLRGTIYNLAAKHGDSEMFEAVKEMYRKETFTEEKVRLLVALGRFPDCEASVLEYAFNSGDVRTNEVVYALAGLGSNTAGRYSAWKFLTENWESIEKKYSGSMNLLPHMITHICNGFNVAMDAEMMESFFRDHPAPGATRVIAEIIERISVNATWYKRDKNDFISAFQPYFDVGP